ncbi:MAG TPA: 3-deoxy-manno-octulosonate cytidylyltransferase [Candidatus Limnocylindrales bacterium]|nr:3-deoxy-manno-octulosonate cytidylyltransferase [Candidatus Limnocylindrales bacterium]
MHATSNDVAVVVIPARYGSTRLPGKPLADLGGMPLVEHVWRRACEARLPSRVLVATDDERIRAALPAEADVVMTRADHPSGSDRIAEVAESLDCAIVVNVQGDLPLLDPTLVDDLIEMLRSDPGLGLATVAVPLEHADELQNPSVVKVVCNLAGRALYFSRAAIPFDRARPGSIAGAFRHVGIYAYRRETLLAFAAMKPTPLEQTESLEQLRALENGIGIGVVRRAHGVPIEVDTPEDLAALRAQLAAGTHAINAPAHAGR